MRFKFKIVLCCLAASCSAPYQIVDVIDLPPPQQVQAERRGEQIIIRWQPGRERRRLQFVGYKLFVASSSLATTPVQELPAPIALAATDTIFVLTTTDTTRLFLHIRSSLGRHMMSLPSLPEVIVPGKSMPSF
ncbi:MAG: hypothetical protein ALAOOOJD_02726 [bacterium]|nr:hypothetical protein [bacterium]